MVAALASVPTARAAARALLVALALVSLAWLLVGPGVTAMPADSALPAYLLGAWLPMVAAMTLPLVAAAGPREGWAATCLAGGYALAWLVAGVAAYWCLRWASRTDAASPLPVTVVGVATLLAAAAHQLTHGSRARLRAAPGRCFGDCAALMGAFLVLGAMSPAAMLAMVALPLAERSQTGRPLARCVGCLLAAAAILALAHPALLAGLRPESALAMPGMPRSASRLFLCSFPK